MSSDDAETLASELCIACVYPRFAEFVRAAITHCALDKEPLTDEQCEMLYLAAFEAQDGVRAQMAHAIDHQSVLAFRRELEAPDA